MATPVANCTKMMLARRIQLDEHLDLAAAFSMVSKLDKASLLARMGALVCDICVMSRLSVSCESSVEVCLLSFANLDM
jgi:hypothetical protein